MTIVSKLRAATFALIAISVAGFVPAAAQDSYPAGPVELLVPFPPGGGTDIVARRLAEDLSNHWEQPVVVVNRPGAATNVGTVEVIRAPADGQKLLIGGRNLTTNEALDPALPYKPMEDLVPITMLTNTSVGLVINPALPVDTVEEFIAYAKEHPGELNVASFGIGTTPHVASELFQERLGVEFVHIIYEGANAARAAVLSNESQVLFTTTTSIEGDVEAGLLKILAVDGEERHRLMPDVPTFAEKNIDFAIGSWFGLLAPAGTPDDVVAEINEAVRTVLSQPETVEFLRSVGSEVVADSPEEFRAFLLEERDVLTPLVAGI